MNLECSKCSVEKDISEFYANKKQSNGVDTSRCKSCVKARQQERSESIKLREKLYYLNNAEKKKADAKKRRDGKKSGLFTVYLIEGEMYVGQTNNIERRLKQHKSKGKNISNVKTLGVFKTKREALDKEAMYHRIGYNGKKQ